MAATIRHRALPRLARIAAALLAASAPVFSAEAFDKDVHQRVTAYSVVLYNECMPNAPLSNAARAALTQAVYDEDDKHPVRRARNWHFFNRDRKLSHNFLLLFDTSLDEVFKDSVREVIAATANGDEEARWPAAGRVAHYLQDMTVPAHVVPIYHGVGIEDSFDAYERTLDSSELQFNRPELCKEIIAAAKAVPAIGVSGMLDWIRDIAVRTQKAIAEPISAACGDITWDKAFWCSPSECGQGLLPGFGAYRPTSAPWGVEQRIAGEPASCDVTKDDYLKLYKGRYRDAVLQTAIWIASVNRKPAAK